MKKIERILSKHFLIIILFFSVLSCSKKKKNEFSEKNASDSLMYYLHVSEDKNISKDIKIKALNQSLKYISILKNTSINRDSLFNISLKFYLLKDWDGFNKSSKLLFNKSQEKKDTSNIVKFFRYRGNYYKKIQVYDSAFFFYSKAEKIYLKRKDRSNYANILFNKGIVQNAINDYSGSELNLFKSYYIFKEFKDNEKILGVLNELGLVCNNLKDFDRSIKYLNEALNIAKNNQFKEGDHQVEICLSNLGFVYQSQKKYDKAIFFYNESLNNNKIKNEAPLLYSNIIDNLGFCKLQINLYDNLPDVFFEALKIRQNLDYKSLEIISNNHISEFYFKSNDNFNAIKFSNQSLLIAKETKNPIDYLTALRQASIVNKNYITIYARDYVRINDSLQIAERNSKDRFARIQLETDEVKKENTVLTNQNIATKRNVVIATTLGLLFVLFRYLKIRQRVQDLKQASQLANEEILKLIISQQNQVDEGKEIEKKRMSKELHDGVLGKLFGLRLNLDGLNMYDDEDSKKIRANYINELKNIEQEIREISHELSREHVAIINNFEAILNNLLYEQSKINKAKLNITISEEIDWEIIPNITKINLYRILQEGLQNINKYASAETINVNFEIKEEKNLYFSLEDDGIGYDAKNKRINGIGMKNMVQRAQQSKGNIEFKSEIGKGSKIIITFPLEIKV